MKNQTSIGYFLDQIKPILGHIILDKADEQRFINAVFNSKAYEKNQMIDFALEMHKIDNSNTGIDILQDEAELHYKKIFTQ